MKNSPLNELTAQDIARKKIKLQKIEDQMNPEHKAYRPGAQKKLAEKHHKTKYQIDTGKRGRPTSLRNEEWLAGTSRKSSSPVNRLDKGEELISSVEGAASGAYRKSALNMLGIKSSPLNDMTEQENDPDLEKFLSGIHTIDNPEYSPPEPADRTEYDYFIKNRSAKTDSVARVFMNLDKQAKAARKAKDIEGARKTQSEINELLEFIKKENENK